MEGTGTEAFQLPKGEVHVWSVPYEGIEEATLKRFREIFPEGLLKRGERLKFADHRKAFWASQGALRFLLAAYLQKDPSSVQIERHPKGKPFSGDDPSLRFNMSDTGGLAIYAFARDSELGVDVEAIRPLKDLEGMIRKNFNLSEREFIGNGKDKLDRFFRFWTFKESYLKAIGEGMRLPPDRLEFCLEKGKPKLISTAHGAADHDLRFEEFVPMEGYTATVTLWGQQGELSHRNWDLRETDALENVGVWK